MDFIQVLMKIGVLFFAVIVHEVAHGYVAYRLGDPTAKDAGRLTLNPLPHIDPVMSVLLPAFLIFSGSPVVFGGAKPVPVNPVYFKKHRRDMMLVSFAGPGSNLILAVLGIVFFALAVKVEFLSNNGVFMLLQYFIFYNIMLAVFNLIPVPPLDGSNILMSLLPDEIASNYAKLAPYGMLIIIALLYFGVFSMIIMPVIMGVEKILNLLMYGG